MALTYGFNVSNAEALMEDISSAYKDFGSSIKTEWEKVIKTLQKEWIGPDEQDFEKEFAKRVSKMYAQAYDLVVKSITNIENLTNKWLDFQNKNTLDGKAIGTAKKVKTPTLPTKNHIIISYKAKTFTNSDDMGLASSTSAETISKEVSQFVKNLKKKADNLFDSISSKSAFFGDQTKKINDYIESVGGTLGEITVAVNDLNKALNQLAKKNYTTSDDNIEKSFKDAASEVSKLSNELGETRWRSSNVPDSKLNGF